MPLAPAVFLTLAAACAPEVAPQTLLAVARVESGLDPLAIGVNGPDRRNLHAASPREAALRASVLIAAGRDVDLGLGQINSRNLAWLGLTVRDAFDPCRSLSAAARVLQAGYARAAPAPGEEQAGLRTALSYYNTGHPTRGLENGYVGKVVAALPQSAAGDAPSAEPAPAPPAWAVFARGRMARAPAFVISPQPGVRP